MDEPVRVTVESDDEATRETVYDTEGAVEVGDATFRFSVGDEAGSAAEPDEADTRSETEDDPLFVAPVSDIPTASTIRRTAMRSDGRRGIGFILRRDAVTDEVYAWRNACPHQPEVPLDLGRGARVDGGDIVCHEHGARFECGDGRCTWGPCAGDELDQIGLAVRDGAVYLDDDRFASCRGR